MSGASWWDVFSDWGAASWQEDVQAAGDEAERTLAQVVTAQGWSDYWTGTVGQYIDEAEDSATSAVDFWTKLYVKLDIQTAAMAGNESSLPGNWTKLRNAWASAAGAAQTAEVSRSAGSVSTVVGGTIKQTAEDIETAADPRKSLIPWALAALAALFLTRGK